ncbi:hypothetical protein DC3_57890 [Deinococcus cellulosilyticus NBRC 106333 = KACC 11606]|uniref:Uncharacterized protein n=2 Tax=Deinococcus cellulosilyticus TaxID=401558 RepID=A0A511NBG9_DEIC1|nr:hypothetical protein DC3_57890 [Deinococcus cellulosilyticus NBRC 106333 = KACC 11606]
MDDADFESIKAQLMASGLPEAQAHETALRIIYGFKTVQPGIIYGVEDDDDVGRIWKRARRAGATRLVMEIKVKDDGHLQVLILERTGENPANPGGN